MQIPLLFKPTALALVVLLTVSPCIAKMRGKRPAKHLSSVAEKQMGAKPVARTFPRYDSPDAAAKYYLQRRLPTGSRIFPVEAYLKAKEHIARMPKHSERPVVQNAASANSSSTVVLQEGLGTWQRLGPGNIGGRTRAFVIDPSNPTTMYSAGVAGGIWKSTDAGASWHAIGDLLPNLAVTTLAMSGADHNVLYAGTGEGYFNFDAVRGAGIFKSSDGGATWVQSTKVGDQNFYYVFKVVVSPVNPSRVYAATWQGIFTSLDAGQTWQYTKVGGPCTDLVMRTDKSTDYLLASCSDAYGSIIFRNTDASNTFANGWSAVLIDSAGGRTSLALAPSNQNVVYALEDQNANGVNPYALHAVYRSDASGDLGSWQVKASSNGPDLLGTLLLTNPLAATLTTCALGNKNFFSNQGWYDEAISVDPISADRVWVGGIDLFRSDDGGSTWGLASYWWNRSVAQFVHADQHGIIFHPSYDGVTNKTIFVVNDGGIFQTDDALAGTARTSTATCQPSNSQFAWKNLNHGYEVTQFYEGAPFADGSKFMGGTQDNGTLLGDQAAGTDWRELLGGDGGYVGINPQNQSLLYASQPGLSLQKSLDGGASWTSATVGITNDEGLFVTPFVLDPTHPSRLWTAGFHIWKSENDASSWVDTSGITPGNGLASAIAVSPVNPNYVAVGMSDGALLLSSSALVNPSWRASGVQPAFITGLTFDPKDANTLYVTYGSIASKHVYKTIDFGLNWTYLDGSGDTALPDIPVNALIVDPKDNSRIYVGSDVGMFVSLDGGKDWAVEEAGFANVPIDSLQLDSSGNTLYAFTHGRGTWRVPLNPRTLRLSATVLNFHNQHINISSPALPLKVTNVSNANVTVAGITTSSRFSYSGACGQLIPGASCDLSVVFTPSVVGPISGSLVINSDSGSVSVTLQGSGFTGPNIRFSPVSLDFGNVIVGALSQPKDIALFNDGDSDLHIQGINTQNTNNGFFLMTSACLDVLAPGASCALRVEAGPAPGLWSDTLKVTSDSPASANFAPLSATGINNPDPAAPGLGTVVPDQVAEGSGPLNIEIQVGNISPGMVIRLNGRDLPTTAASPWLKATVPASNFAKLGQLTVTVYVPADGKTYPAGYLTVYLPIPAFYMAFEPFTRKIYALTNPNSQSTWSGCLLLIDPFAGTGSCVARGGFTHLTVAPSGRYVYLGGQNHIWRYSVAGKTIDWDAPVSDSYSYGVQDLAALPNDDEYVLVSYELGRVGMFRNGVLQGVEFSPTASYFPYKLQFANVTDLIFENQTVGGMAAASVNPFATLEMFTNNSYEELQTSSKGVVQLEQTYLPTGVTAPFQVLGNIGFTKTGLAFALDTHALVHHYDDYTRDGNWTRPETIAYLDPGGNKVIYVDGYGARVFDLHTAELLSSTYFSGLYDSDFSGSPTFAFYAPNAFAYANFSDGVAFAVGDELNPRGNSGGLPHISSASPAVVQTGSRPLYIRISGTGFGAGSQVRLNGQDRTTYVKDDQTLFVALPATDFASAGSEQLVVFNPGANGGTSASLALIVLDPPLLVSPGALSFTSVLVHQTAGIAVNLKNTTSGQMTISSITSDNPAFSATNNCAPFLAAGASCTAIVRFSPNDVGPQSGVLSIASDLAGIQKISMFGKGVDIQLTLSRPPRPPRSAPLSSSFEVTAGVSIRGASTSNAVSLSCSIGSVEYACSLRPATVTLDKEGAAKVAVLILPKQRRSSRLRSRREFQLTVHASSEGCTVEKSFEIQP